MDELDAAILREIHRGRVLLWGGSDPRLRTTDLARRLGVDRTTVWARLKAWKDEGFLVRQEVVPNPHLFGAGIAGGDVKVADARGKPSAIEALGLVDGVLCGVDLLGPYVMLVYALESEAALARCTRLVGRLPGVAEVSMCVPFEAPRSAIAPTARDWRILRALRRAPDRPFDEVAREADVSRRTLTRRYGELLAANAIWTFPVLDFTRYRRAVMARFVVLLAAKGKSAGLVNACRKGLGRRMVMWESLEDVVRAPGDHPPWVDVYCHLESVGEAEDVERWLLERPDVADVEVYFPKSWFVVGSWFDERIERALKAADKGAAPSPRQV